MAEQSCIGFILLGFGKVALLLGLGGKLLSHLRQRKVGNVIFQSMRHRVVVLLTQGAIACFDIFVYVGAKQVLRTWCCGAFFHCLVSQTNVEVAHAAQPSVNNHRNCRVAFHGERLAAEQLPLGQPSALAIDVEHRVHHFNLAFGIHHGHHLMQVAVSVPKREHSVTLSLGGLDFVAFHCRILAVDVV